MTIEKWSAVDRYFDDAFALSDALLDRALEASDAAGLPPHHVSAAHGKFLMLLARLVGARRILEIGTLGGYSTIWLARALSKGDCLITLEAEARHVEVARSNVARAGLSEIVEVRSGRALDTLARLVADGAGPFDLIFIDADKANNAEYLSWSLKLARKGSVIVADNIVRNGAVIEARSSDPSVRGVRRFNELIASTPCLSATALQTVGTKGYDGFVLALVTSDP